MLSSFENIAWSFALALAYRKTNELVPIVLQPIRIVTRAAPEKEKRRVGDVKSWRLESTLLELRCFSILVE